MAQPPKLTQHASGVWKVRWGGRDHYFTKDRAESERAFHDPQGEHPGSLIRWSRWRAAKLAKREVEAARSALTVVELAERFLLSYANEDRLETARWFRNHLRRFLLIFGRLRAEELTIGALQAFKTDLLAMRKTDRTPLLAPKTIGHDLTAIKTMLRWAADHELAPVLNLRAVKPPASRPPAPERLTREQVLAWLGKAERADRALACYMALNYLCLARPSEIVRLARHEGRFDPVRMPDCSVHPRGVFVLERSKTEHRVSFPRHLVMSDEALIWFDSLSMMRDRFNTLNAYSAAVRARSGRSRPKALQKSAAWHLQLAGVDLAEVDLLLGHEPTGVWRSYARREFGVLRQRASLLTLRSSG